MTIVDETGNFAVDSGTLKTVESENPVFKARIALALPVGTWLYAPTAGHELAIYDKVHASESKKEEFLKNVKLYLKPYGPEVVSRFSFRGALNLHLHITKETLNV